MGTVHTTSEEDVGEDLRARESLRQHEVADAGKARNLRRVMTMPSTREYQGADGV